FHISWMHTQDPKAKPNSRFNASVNAGSSNYYKNTISSPANFLSNTFQSSIQYSKTFPNSPINFGISASQNQNTLTRDVSVTLPQITFGVTRINPFTAKNRIGTPRWYEKIGVHYQLEAKNFVQTKDTLLFKEET